MGNHKKAEALLQRAVEMLPPSIDVTWRAQVECNHAMMKAQLGNPDSARRTITRWATDRAVEAEAATQCEMYRAHIAQNTKDAEGALQHALTAQLRLLPAQLQGGRPYSMRTGQMWLPLARLRADDGDLAGARTVAHSALEHFSRMLDATHADWQEARRLAAE